MTQRFRNVTCLHQQPILCLWMNLKNKIYSAKSFDSIFSFLNEAFISRIINNLLRRQLFAWPGPVRPNSNIWLKNSLNHSHFSIIFGRGALLFRQKSICACRVTFNFSLILHELCWSGDDREAYFQSIILLICLTTYVFSSYPKQLYTKEKHDFSRQLIKLNWSSISRGSE